MENKIIERALKSAKSITQIDSNKYEIEMDSKNIIEVSLKVRDFEIIGVILHNGMPYFSGIRLSEEFKASFKKIIEAYYLTNSIDREVDRMKTSKFFKELLKD